MSGIEKTSLSVDGYSVALYTAESPRILFLQPVDEHDAASLEGQIKAMESCALPFALTAFQVSDWNRDLSPWEAPPAFGKVPFGGGASRTLDFVTGRLMPEVRAALAVNKDTPACIGGYSLAGLFALWASTQSGMFSAVAAASPSVWFPGWIDCVREHPIRAERVYLSLGDREERTKNPVMARVGDCIRELYGLLRDDHSVTLEWNPGNHFRDPELRNARAFCWVAAQEANADGPA